MTEYARVSASTYDLDSLVNQLNEKAADGWDVVSIVPTGADVTAILKRTAGAAAETALPVEYAHLEVAEQAAVVETAVADVVPEPEPEPVVAAVAAEPSGWAVAPEPAPEVVPEPVVPAPEPVVVAPIPEPAPAVVTPEPAPAVVAPAPAPAPTPAPAAAPAAATTPAGWYPDPSGRFELRYWDGSQWTEYVSRAGQQFTDPPVA